MDKKMILVGAMALGAAVAGGFWLGRSSSPDDVALVGTSEQTAAQPPKQEQRDVPGLPVLFVEGREYEKNDISLADYFAEFQPTTMIDPETKKLRPEAAARLEQELVGKQVTWEGYVRRVETAPSGRLVLVFQLEPGAASLYTAMAKFSPTWSDELLGYRQGQRVRVVGLFGRVFSLFPSLNGMSVEAISESARNAEAQSRSETR